MQMLTLYVQKFIKSPRLYLQLPSQYGLTYSYMYMTY